MKRFLTGFFLLAMLLCVKSVLAEGTAAKEAPAQEQASKLPPLAAEVVTPAPALASDAEVAEVPEEVKDGAEAENLEFVSGEVSAIDEAAKTVTVKLYGETENETKEKVVTVKIDDSTDITDGENDRDLKSLTAGTEVDVEYDPTSKLATYIFIY
jgi:DNA segregation ATPase FtsK/SpoIIIE-like protein